MIVKPVNMTISIVYDQLTTYICSHTQVELSSKMKSWENIVVVVALYGLMRTHVNIYVAVTSIPMTGVHYENMLLYLNLIA